MENDELITEDQAWQMVKDAGIQRSTKGSFVQWRSDHGIKKVSAVRRAEVEEAIDKVLRHGHGR
jgi:hypothetical protein